MPISTTHNIHTGCIVCASDLSPLLASLEGEIVPNPLNAPHLQELTSGGTITDSTTYRYRYSYISWRITNGVMEITEESRCSPIAALTTGTNGNTARIQVIYAPPAYGTANGVIIYIENTGNPGQYYAKGIITDIVTQSWIDTTVGFTDKTRQPMPINTFQASQPMMPVGSKLGLPIPFKNLTENLVATTVSSGSPYVFTKNQDFLLMSVTYQSVATDSTSVEVYTTASGFRVWIHDEVNSTESSHFVFPVPIPYTETGISVSAGTVAIIGAYTGINRTYVSGLGKSVNIFCSQIQGPTASPSKAFVVPANSRAIVTYMSPQTSTVTNPWFGLSNPLIGCNLVLGSGGSTFVLMDTRLSSPSSMFGGGIFGSWNRGHINPMIQPLVMDELEYLTTTTTEKANIFGYIFHE